ncbi:ankyrin repeat domain-containing protein SOWAHB isoform X2 [Cephus cinctus]|uniref:Ankyrin repeat domain-containing protein SOWAHB isoform X2 n=1 Tax=Cephus cinctus TaxID=211228 RepID=A0AAJ7C4W3_CEPCN|nr:ankyrin repeat domain-containing protein SOWAHB isoform X2 [Cephus cinctus]
MATPSELSLEEIRKYLLENGGSARNHDVVKHFKKFLTDPETRVEARNKFKEYVNTLATIKNEEGEKYLVLKKKYRQGPLVLSSPVPSAPFQQDSSVATPDLATPVSPLREPPPYRPPPPAPLSPTSPSSPVPRYPDEPLYPVGASENVDKEETTEENSKQDPEEVVEEDASQVSSPPVPPRRKSQDKLRLENKENINMDKMKPTTDNVMKEDVANTGSAEQLSVRERMQRFNRMASETDMNARPNGTTTPTKKRSDKGADEDDSASVASQLDGKSREWLVRAAQGDYQALAKLAAEEPRLARLKDPSSYTALHWGAKHGNENIVKLIAGTYKDYIKGVNETTNGGYTPLHIAMQFEHENIFNLLVQVYGANQDVRDYSGKKARQYLVSQEAAVSQDTFRKIKARKKHAEKDLGFLRIGSLNVRVKRTTEAFSQFLGVATSANSNAEKIHKSWGSADNIQMEHKVMPPPKYAPIKKRRSRRAQDFSSSRGQHTVSQPNTPVPQGKVFARQNPSVSHEEPSGAVAPSESLSVNRPNNDSDSDTACGFDSAWRGSAQL